MTERLHLSKDHTITVKVFPSDDLPGVWLAEAHSVDIDDYTNGAGVIMQGEPGSGPCGALEDLTDAIFDLVNPDE